MINFLKTTPKKYLLAAAAIAVCLFLVSTWRLSASPATWFDEGINLGIAKEWLNHGIYSLSVGPNEVVTTRQFLITTNYPVIAPVAMSLALFGNSFLAARLPMVLFLFIFVCLAFFVAKREGGAGPALWSAALIITFAPFYGNGKAVLGEVPGLVFFLSSLLCLPKTYRPEKLFLSGLLSGLAVATKPFFLVAAAALFFGELIFSRSNLKNLLCRLGYIALGALVPILIWLFTIVPNFTPTGLLSVVQYYSNSYAATSFLATILKNFFRFFSEVTPIHLTILVGSSLLAWYQMRKQGSRASELKVIVWIFILLNLVWYLKTPGWYRYFFTAHLVAFIWFPASIEKILPKKIALAFLTAFLLAQSAYLVTKRHDPLYYATETLTAEQALETVIKPGQSVLFVNAPSLAFATSQVNTSQFLQINPVLFFGKDSLISGSGSLYDFVVVEGDLAETALKSEAKKLSTNYELVNSVGHYSIYRRL